MQIITEKGWLSYPIRLQSKSQVAFGKEFKRRRLSYLSLKNNWKRKCIYKNITDASKIRDSTNLSTDIVFPEKLYNLLGTGVRVGEVQTVARAFQLYHLEVGMFAVQLQYVLKLWSIVQYGENVFFY